MDRSRAYERSSNGRSSFSQSDRYNPYTQRNRNNDHGRRSDGYDNRDGGYNDRSRFQNDRGYQNDRGSSGGYQNDRRSDDGFPGDRRSGGEYGDRRSGGGYGDRRSGGGYGDRGRGFGNRGRGGPGTGKARDDDSKTEPLPSTESRTIPLNELVCYPMIYKKQMPAKVNAHSIDAKKGKVVYQYDIQWEGTTSKGKRFNLNTQTKAAHRLQLKQSALFTVFDQLLREHKKFFGFDENESQFVYDTGSIFFAHKKLDIGEEPRKLNIDVAEFSQEAKDYYRDIESAVATVTLAGEINLNILNGDLDNDRSIIQYLELAFSQEQRKKGEFFCFGNEFFEKNSAEVIYETPFVLKNGCKRSIRLIGDPADKKLAIHIIPKKTAFYGITSILELIQHTIKQRIDDIWLRDNLDKANKAVSLLAVSTTHLESNLTFVSCGLTNDSAAKHTFKMDGNPITVADYFLKTHNKQLRYPELPCLIQAGGNNNCYPLEVLVLAEAQKIPKAKQDKTLTAKITNKCSFDPFQNIIAIEDQREKGEILNSNDYIKNTGCRVDAQRLIVVPARQFYPPAIVFKNTQKTLNSGLFGMQVGDQFVQPAFVQKMACVFASRKISNENARYFVDEFIKRLRLYGVTIKEHQFIEWTRAGYDCDRLKQLEKDGFTYVFAIGDDDELHHGLKLMELKTRLVTQHVMTRTIEKPNNTLYDNLAFKLNLRAGGINWTLSSDPALILQYQNVDLLKSLMHNTMFFGIDLSHPLNTNEPTCVGFASNLFATSACMSKGDFGYQSARETLINPKLLASKFADALKAYRLRNGGFPSWVVVYRAGLSEGEIPKIQEQEIPVLKTAIEELQSKNAEFDNVKFTFIMSNENTNYRLFKEVIDKNDKAPAQNLPPGTCVSEVVVSQKNPSFILISQRPLKGTAHPSCYYVLDGANVVPFDHLQWLTYCLCYTNTTNLPTSLCAPLESAADLSKRARNNLKQWELKKTREGGSTGAVNMGWPKKGDKKNGKEDEYMDMLNEKLKAVIIEERFWA